MWADTEDVELVIIYWEIEREKIDLRSNTVESWSKKGQERLIQAAVRRK